MKLSKVILSMLLLIGSVLSFAQERYSVTAKSGLTIRKEPNSDGEKVGKLAYGKVVTVLEKTDFTFTISDNGQQVHGNWVKISTESISRIASEQTYGYVFDGYLTKHTSATTSRTIEQEKELVLYKLRSSGKSPTGKIGFVSLTDSYAFYDDESATIINQEYLGEQEVNNDNYHVLKEAYRTRFLKSLGIRETDSVFVYHFLTDAVYSAEIKTLPVVAKINAYGSQTPVGQEDYVIGLELDESVLPLGAIKNYYSKTMIYIGSKDPFNKGKLRPVLWERVAPSRFPLSHLEQQDSLRADEYLHNETFEFSSGEAYYYLQNRTRNGQVYARHFKVLTAKKDTLLFDKIFDPGEGAALLTLNTVLNKKQNNGIAVWTGSLFKNRPPIITDFISHSFGCTEIYFLEPTEASVRVRCDNRH